MTQKNRVFGTSLVGGYGVEIKIEADITVLVTYRRSQEIKKTACFYFVLCSLFRTFATYPLCGHKEVNVKRLRS